MKQIFEAFDGTQFNSEIQCREYEKVQSEFKMYDHTGRVNQITTAYVVELPTELSADIFLAQFSDSEDAVKGIKSGDTGLFVWDYQKEEFAYLCDYAIGALRQYFNDNKGV